MHPNPDIYDSVIRIMNSFFHAEEDMSGNMLTSNNNMNATEMH